MSQTSGFAATEVPQDITAGLEPGCYMAQPKGGVAFATAASAPAWPESPDAPHVGRLWFQVESRETFTFRVAPGISPTWVVAWAFAGLDPVDIAIARIGP